VTTPETVELVLLILAVVLLSMSAARRLPVPYPVLLVLAGLAASFVPGLPPIRLDPELVFFVFLPPVLWSAAYFTSLREFRANARPITLLAVGLVLATTVAVAVCARWLIPGLSWPTALALGAIVSPPDAVSATAVVRALGVPRRVLTILEGESLVNDATALILYRGAVAVAIGGVFSPGLTALQFVLAAVLGVGLGYAIGRAAVFALRVTDDAPTSILITLMAPYLAWMLGEYVHASAVLACVAGGITFRRAPLTDISPRARLQSQPVWDLVVFVANGVLFLLIGLQLRGLAADVPAGGLVPLLVQGAAVTAVVVAVRLVWVPLFAWLPRALSPRLRARDPMPAWQSLFLIGWTGLRGIVSLAAAMALPLRLADGSPLPFRSELLLITFTVIFCTLVLQGLTLAPLVRALRFPSDGEGEREELEARSHAARSALARLEELTAEPWAEAGALSALREQYQDRLRRANGGESSLLADRAAKRARFESLMAERQALDLLRRQQQISDDLLLVLESELDLEAARHGLAELRRVDALRD
jgi:Na+/H+ antiporter